MGVTLWIQPELFVVLNSKGVSFFRLFPYLMFNNFNDLEAIYMVIFTNGFCFYGWSMRIGSVKVTMIY